ncbi:MAG: DUF1501 domain-containing protein [Planctomycetaceae bacterium]
MPADHPLRRRDFLKCSAACAAGSTGLFQALSLAASEYGGHPLAPKLSHAPAKAKQLLFVFLTGGFSHVDTFDPKPKLAVNDGKSVPAVHLRGVDKLPLMGSPFRFRKCGESGIEISELFPHLQSVADDLCVVRSLHTDIVEHFQAVMAMHTGSATVPLPSIGSWLSYGLGTLNRNLPPYVVLAEHLTYAGSQVWDSNFLPPVHQGVRIVPGEKPIPDLDSPAPSLRLRELERMMLDDANKLHADARPGDLNLRASMNSFDVARGMMRIAPEVFDIARETPATLEMYGVKEADRKSFAWQCLIARRLIESGVRTVELIDTGSSNNWDSHGNMQDHRPKARRVDQALTALINDLKQRGLFDETLMVICTEFGRTPWTDNPKTRGRNHYARAFSSLLAGAGVKGGNIVGATDEHGIDIIDSPCHINDYHATILHLMGIDHKRLTYRYAGRDFRLTDVHGRVISEVFA